MSLKLNPYLGFKDNARQAMEYYHGIFGGDLKISSFKEFHASTDPSEDNLVMHAVIESDNLTLMASDTPARMEYKPGTNLSVSLSGDTVDDAKLSGYFDKLADGGTITMPLEKAIWGDKFGMCTDKFGIQWLVNIAGPKPAEA